MPEMRDKLKVDSQEGRLVLLANEKQVAKAILHVVNDLASGKIKTDKIYTRPQRLEYINNLPASILPTAKKGPVTPASIAAHPKTKAVTGSTTTKKRDRLIPRDCALNVTVTRIRYIEIELRGFYQS